MKLNIVPWIVFGSLGLTFVLIAIFVGPLILGALQTRDVLAHGVPAEARVLNLTDTGSRINQQPLIAVQVQVMPANAPAYVAVFRRVITVADADAFRRGNIISVKFDAAHPNRVAAVTGP